MPSQRMCLKAPFLGVFHSENSSTPAGRGVRPTPYSYLPFNTKILFLDLTANKLL